MIGNACFPKNYGDVAFTPKNNRVEKSYDDEGNRQSFIPVIANGFVCPQCILKDVIGCRNQ